MPYCSEPNTPIHFILSLLERYRKAEVLPLIMVEEHMQLNKKHYFIIGGGLLAVALTVSAAALRHRFDPATQPASTADGVNQPGNTAASDTSPDGSATSVTLPQPAAA